MVPPAISMVDGGASASREGRRDRRYDLLGPNFLSESFICLIKLSYFGLFLIRHLYTIKNNLKLTCTNYIHNTIYYQRWTALLKKGAAFPLPLIYKNWSGAPAPLKHWSAAPAPFLLWSGTPAPALVEKERHSFSALFLTTTHRRYMRMSYVCVCPCSFNF